MDSFIESFIQGVSRHSSNYQATQESKNCYIVYYIPRTNKSKKTQIQTHTDIYNQPTTHAHTPYRSPYIINFHCPLAHYFRAELLLGVSAVLVFRLFCSLAGLPRSSSHFTLRHDKAARTNRYTTHR